MLTPWLCLCPPQSVFGKGLTTLLNEYVATRAKGEVSGRGSVDDGAPLKHAVFSTWPQSPTTRFQL